MLTKMFQENLEVAPVSRSFDWLRTEAKDAFQQADTGELEQALGRLTVITADLVGMCEYYAKKTSEYNGR